MPDLLRQLHGRAAERIDRPFDLGQPEARFGHRCADIGREQQFDAARDAVAVDRGDDRLRERRVLQQGAIDRCAPPPGWRSDRRRDRRPSENALSPAPVKTTTRHSGSPSSRSHSAARSAIIARVIALRRISLAIVTTVMWRSRRLDPDFHDSVRLLQNQRDLSTTLRSRLAGEKRRALSLQHLEAALVEIGAVPGGVRRDQHARHRPQRMIGGQRLLLEHVERRRRRSRRPQRSDEVVEPRRHAAPDIDEERACASCAETGRGS